MSRWWTWDQAITVFLRNLPFIKEVLDWRSTLDGQALHAYKIINDANNKCRPTKYKQPTI
jgi:hypothetical protein